MHVAFGVSTYSFPFSCGFAREGDRRAPQPMDAFGLIALASQHGLSSVETPLPGMLPDLSAATIDRFRGTLEEAGLGLVVDTGVVDVERLQTLLPLAARAGAKVVRAMLSTILEGARAGIPGGWFDYVHEIRRRILEVCPLLEEYDLQLAIENHQDATSDDLIDLCEACGPRLGVTLDVSNPLAVGEEPLHFARKVGTLIRNVHLKDYRVYPTSSGYRLVRCVLGDGVVAFDELLKIVREEAPDATYHVELAALHARHIRLLEDGWWQGYPPRDVRELVPALRLVARYVRPAGEDWRTPWEAGAPPEKMGRYERDQFEASVRYLRSLRA